MLKKYKKPIILLIVTFFIQFLGNPVPKHYPAETLNTVFDYIIFFIGYVFLIIGIIWILMLYHDKSE